MPYCTICQNNYTSNYCPNCGQTKIDKRATFKSFAEDLFDNLFSLHKSLYSNLKTLLFDPGRIVNNYLEGYRNHHMSPGRLFIIASLIVALGLKSTNGNFFIVSIGESTIQIQFLFLFIFILNMTVSSYLTYFIPWKRSLTEHVIIGIYNISVWTIFFTPMAIIHYLLIDNKIIAQIFFVLFILLIVIWNNRLFNIENTFKRFIYVFFNFVLFFGSMILLSILT